MSNIYQFSFIFQGVTNNTTKSTAQFCHKYKAFAKQQTKNQTDGVLFSRCHYYCCCCCCCCCQTDKVTSSLLLLFSQNVARGFSSQPRVAHFIGRQSNSGKQKEICWISHSQESFDVLCYLGHMMGLKAKAVIRKVCQLANTVWGVGVTQIARVSAMSTFYLSPLENFNCLKVMKN